MPGLSGRMTYTDRKRARANHLESEYDDFGPEDLPETIGAFELSYTDPDGDYCPKHDESYQYEHPDGRTLEITMTERSHSYEVLTRTTNDGVCYTKDEEVGHYGYLGQAAEAAEDRFGGDA
ncbi:hypothetical protein HTZ84_22165 [Haloterrigena sp. SYSU A558-1]|uniref:Uncharacterized protein n=1 Tax=Haloterrigena gelatinilytica TaxID=2741724 RepID=A0ABX2LKM1_9EURY|nr:hypothetical protein [Haloterrigena gelatinilytica]NUC74973.1 hypothetical protein [Haloterrigena gelatinilytica]